MRLAIASVLFSVSIGSAIAGPPSPEQAPPAANNLDRAAISEGIAKAKAKVVACGDSTKGTGKVKVRVQVSSDGKVTSATPEGGSSDALRTCVAGAIKSVTFKKTASGGSFSYPFVFSAPASTTPPASPPSSPPASPPAAPGSPPSPPPAADADGNLDRVAISEGIAKVKSNVQACAKTSKAKGVVKVSVTVTPAGAVGSAKVERAPDQALGTCVAAAISKATFRKSKGGSFSYPFVF